MSQEREARIRKEYAKAGQDHVFAFWSQLNDDEKNQLLDQLETIDPVGITKLVKEQQQDKDDVEKKEDNDIEPLECASIEEGNVEEWRELGMQQIAQGHVAVILLAGGQGTRLGSSDPKGCFDIGLPSHKALFQLQAERILKLQEMSGGSGIIPWYIMASKATMESTRNFFTRHDYFGLNPENIILFNQGTLPCIKSDDNKLMLATPCKVAESPDGNGGIYKALVENGILNDMNKRGILHTQLYCVDNALVKVADPVFIGFAISQGKKTGIPIQIATKVVIKQKPQESVGLIVSKSSHPAVIEYSELDKSMAEERDEKDSNLLKFRAANIVNHYSSSEFLNSIPNWSSLLLPLHVANKKIPYIDIDSGKLIQPTKPNGFKLEQFVFDIFPKLEMNQFASLQVNRSQEFSPLKNGENSSSDNAKTSCFDVLQQGRNWLENIGAIVHHGVEISPLVSYAGEGLESLRGKTIKTNLIDHL